MEFLETYGKEIVALIVPFIAWALNTFFKGKARLRIAQPHTFTFTIQEPLKDPQGKVVAATQTIQTRSFMVQNAGREQATKVELVFNWKPMCLNIWPPRHFEEHVEADKRYVIVFSSLSPGETVGCEVLSINVELPNLVTVRCDQAVGVAVNMYPQPVPNRVIRAASTALLALGLASAVYWAILLIQFLVLRTPLGH